MAKLIWPPENDINKFVFRPYNELTMEISALDNDKAKKKGRPKKQVEDKDIEI